MQISLDAKVAKDLGIKLNDTLSLKIYGRDVEGKVVNFRKVDYRDLSINFVILINPKFAVNIPHEYIATAKFSSAINFKEGTFLQNFKNISAIKVSNYLGKITEIVNKIFIAVTVISSVAVIIGFTWLFHTEKSLITLEFVKTFIGLMFFNTPSQQLLCRRDLEFIKI